jgi:Protein of unknown function (DUF3237)
VPNLLSEASPEMLDGVRTRPLFRLHEQVPPLYVVGHTPNAFRRIGVITGGSFAGERLSGEVVSGGNDWQSVRSDSSVKLDVRLLLKTTDGALIAMTYQVLRHGPPAVMHALDHGETVDPASYYFRLSGFFETGAQQYDWLNRVIAIGIGDRHADGPVYSIFEVL